MRTGSAPSSSSGSSCDWTANGGITVDQELACWGCREDDYDCELPVRPAD